MTCIYILHIHGKKSAPQYIMEKNNAIYKPIENELIFTNVCIEGEKHLLQH